MTLTKEWLEQTIVEIEAIRDEIPFGLEEYESNMLAAMKLALASLESDRKLNDFFASQESLGVDFERVLTENIEELYVPGNTAPPAPVVPDSGREQFEEWFKFHHGEEGSIVTLHRANGGANYRDEFVDLAWIAWKDSRAAMLQGAEPVTTANKLREGVAAIRNSGIAIDAEKIQAERDALNSPAIPDGWVACSERMPETSGNYWGWWSESKRQGPVWFIKSELQAQFQSSEITHWMPLPAAPQQEVKSGR